MATTDMNAQIHIKDDNGNVNNIFPATKIANVEGLTSALNAKADTTTVTNQLSGKVDKETGKGLSTNDYTSAEKNKLSGIEAQANKTVVDSALSSSSENPVQNKVINTALGTKANASDVTTALAAKADASAVSSLTSRVTQTETDIATQTARIDSIASLPSGSTSGDAELMDIRIKADGTTAANAGTAVREQIEELNVIVNNNDIISRVLEGWTINFTGSDEYPMMLSVNNRAMLEIPVRLHTNDVLKIKINADSTVRIGCVYFDVDGKIVRNADPPTWTTTGEWSLTNFAGYINLIFRYSDNSSVAGISADIASDTLISVIPYENKKELPVVRRIYSGRIQGGKDSVTIESNDACFYTDFIPVIPGEKYLINCTIAGMTGANNALGVCGYSTPNISDFVDWVFNIEIAGETSNNWYTYNNVEITIPDNVNYITLTTRVTDQRSIIALSSSWLRKISTEVDIIKHYANNYAPFAGLKAVAFGCSLTARGRNNDPEYPAGQYFGYTRELEKISGMSIDNKGVGGSCLYNTGDSIYKRILAYENYADKDVAIIEGDFNGWNTSKPLGTYKDTGTDTSCGCLYNAVQHIKTQNSNTTIFVLLDHYGKYYDSTWNGASTEVRNNLTQYEYYSELKKVCDYHGIICIPMYESVNINELNPQYIADFIHLNALGEKQCGRAVYEKMKTFMRQVVSVSNS